ncbi:hypothetical protein F5Y03DRAFT_365120 [Xylaria venustula]|nr:hypothetical protein F5Y03DRAFT_365120 [Xylaria venustula]
MLQNYHTISLRRPKSLTVIYNCTKSSYKTPINQNSTLSVPRNFHTDPRFTPADMEIDMEGLLRGSASFLLGRAVVNGMLIFLVDKLIVQRRDVIVPKVRRLQSAFKIPPFLFVVSDTAPGIEQKELRAGAELVTFGGTACLGIFGLVALHGKVKSVWGAVFGIAFPVFIVILTWAFLISARRRFDRGDRKHFVEGNSDSPGLSLQAAVARALFLRKSQ